MFVVCLIEKYVFSIASIRCPFFEYSLFVDAMFRAKSLPEDRAYLVAALAQLDCDNFSRHILVS